jgi:hypothetical protein
MSSSPWKKNQPEAVADKVLRRAEVSKVSKQPAHEHLGGKKNLIAFI